MITVFQAESNKPATAEALLDESTSRSQSLPSSRQTPAANPGPNPVSSRQRRGACERADVFRINPGTKWKPQIQLKNNAGRSVPLLNVLFFIRKLKPVFTLRFSCLLSCYPPYSLGLYCMMIMGTTSCQIQEVAVSIG